MKLERFKQSLVGDQNGQSDKSKTNKNPELQERTKISSSEIASEKIQSAESKVAKLITDGQQKIDRIEQNSGLPSENDATVIEKVELFSRLSKIKDEANNLLNRLKEKISSLLSKEKDSNLMTEKPEISVGSKYDELKERLKREQREISGPVIEEARRKRNQLLEARGLLPMPKEDFDTYFSSKNFEIHADLKQQNVADCYVVAAIHAMSRSPHFETICRSSMKKMLDGTWQVRVPLMSEDGQIITIRPEELLPHKNRQFLKRSKRGGAIPDLRKKLMPVKGKEGLQVLEAAFIKRKFGSVDRLAAEGGWGEEALLKLGGDNFKKYSIHSAVFNQKSKKWEYPGLNSLDEKSMAYLDHYLENFDPEIHMATASTKHGVGNITGFYKAKGTAKFLVHGHAYSISGIDAEKKIVKLANPWNTSKPIEMTFDQFKENFSSFNAIRIDSAKLLRNMRSIEKKSA